MTNLGKEMLTDRAVSLFQVLKLNLTNHPLAVTSTDRCERDIKAN